jgi:uncharacterized protein DUF6448
MKSRFTLRRLAAALALPLAFSLVPLPADAHCDGIDGPVVAAARRALDTGNVNHALVWVQEGDARGIEDAFRMASAVRGLGPEAKKVADHHFFETLVRVHRAGEGAAYTGLKPAGRDLGPSIPAADRALETGNLEPLEDLVVDATREGLKRRFAAAMAKKTFAADDVATGRQYVSAYVEYIHGAERAYEAAGAPAHAVSAEPSTAGHGAH